jgi:hypothetical protein
LCIAQFSLRWRYTTAKFVVVRRKKAPLKNKGHRMESKGKRAARVSGPVETPVETSIEPPISAEIHAEITEPTETAVPFAEPHLAVPESSGSLTLGNGPASEEIADFGRETLAAFARSQAALARGLEALSAEMAGLALSGIDTAARAATKMLGVKTLSDAIDVNTGFTRSSFDALVGGSARLSELGVKLAAETSQPLFSQLGKAWIKPARRGS